MELRHLRYFLAVVDAGAFGRAAERLHVSQPPLSRQIRDLEQELGVQLLERGRRGAAPTAAGEVFHAGCRDLLRALDQLVVRTTRVGRGEAGTLRVGYSQSAAELMVDAVSRFRARYPDVDVEIAEQRGGEQAEALRRGDVDLTLGYRLPALEHSDLSAVELFSDPVRLAVPQDRAVSRRFDPRVLAGLPLLFIPRSAAGRLHDAALDALAKIGVRPPAVRGVASVRTVLTLVGAGAGFGLVPDSIASGGSRGVRFLSPSRLRLRLSTHAFIRRPTPATKAMLEVLRGLARDG